MARDISDSLRAALVRTNHEPILRLQSSDMEAAIPFDGNAFALNQNYAFRPYMITHSNGNILIVMRDHESGTSADTLIFTYIDQGTSEINRVDIATASNIDAVTLVEMADGNVGVVIARYGYSATTGYLERAILTPEGVVVESFTTLTTYPRASSGTYGLTGLSIDLFSDGTYYLVYCYTTSSAFALYRMTSTDWSSWTGPTAISHGLTTTNCSMEGVYVFETDENDCFLVFSYTDILGESADIYNIYSMMSTDYGATWGSPEARTTYTDAGSSAFSPVLIQQSSGTMYMLFYERSNVLRLDEDSLGWQDSDFYACPYGFNAKTIYYNPSTGHITCSYGRAGSNAGTAVTCGVLVIDAATFTIIDNFNEYSSPSFPSVFGNTDITEDRLESAQGTKFICGTAYASRILFAVIDVEARSIDVVYIAETADDTYYDAYGYSVTNVVTRDQYDTANNYTPSIVSIALNEPNADTIYILARHQPFELGVWLLYMDIADLDTVNGGDHYCGTWTATEIQQTQFIRALDNESVIVIGSGGTSQGGGIQLISMSSLASLGSWSTSTFIGFPYYGCYLTKPAYMDGHIYFNVRYSSAAGYENQRGLCNLNASNNTISFIRPTWTTEDNYALDGCYFLDTVNNCIWIAPLGSMEPGSPESYVLAARYNITNGSWTTYTQLSIQGLPNACTCSIGQNITMDAVNGNVYVALGGSLYVSGIRGIVAFNVSNEFTQIKYLTADKDVNWDWDTHDDIGDMVLSTSSSNPAATVDTNDVIWAVWDVLDFTDSTYTPYWDRDEGALNLYDYLIGTLKIRWEVKKPNELEFTLSRGHLFDPTNTYSILQDTVRQGRRITVEIGEMYNGDPYYENQGTFITTELRISYKLRQYPVIHVKAKSQSAIWQEQHIIATDLYSTTPQTALVGLLRDHAGLEYTEYNIPTFEDTHDIEHQFVDVSVWDAVEEITDHWFYNPYDDMDGVFTLVRLDVDKELDHVYVNDIEKLLDFSPDTSYSDFTNSVLVTGESMDYTDVTYDEEIVGTLAGTIGWWENTQTRKVLYSQSGSNNRVARYPRLEVLQSISFQGPLLDAIATSEGGEYISEIDDDEQYCVVTIDVPDLTVAVVAAISALIALGATATTCDGYLQGWCGPLMLAIVLDITAVFYILMAVANYQYNIWATPMGTEKTTIQYIANDTDHQRNLNGRIVQKVIDDSFCYTVAECSRVASGNLAIVQGQRNRVTFKKVTHLQDELLDKIRVPHPYTDEPFEILIVGLTRTFTKGSGAAAGFYDEIEGWRIV